MHVDFQEVVPEFWSRPEISEQVTKTCLQPGPLPPVVLYELPSVLFDDSRGIC